MKSKKLRQQAARPSQGDDGDFKVVATNRQARHDYDILQAVEAGVALMGSEIKSIREGRTNIAEGYARPFKEELWLYGVHIPIYKSASYQNHEPTRTRKLLLHRKQIGNLTERMATEGLSLVPLRLYFKRHRLKVELGLARGRKHYDKRQAIAKRDAQRRIQQAVRLKVKGSA